MDVVSKVAQSIYKDIKTISKIADKEASSATRMKAVQGLMEMGGCLINCNATLLLSLEAAFVEDRALIYALIDIFRNLDAREKEMLPDVHGMESLQYYYRNVTIVGHHTIVLNSNIYWGWE